MSGPRGDKFNSLQFNRVDCDQSYQLEIQLRSIQATYASSVCAETIILKAVRRQHKIVLEEQAKLEHMRIVVDQQQGNVELASNEQIESQRDTEKVEQRDTISKYEHAELERVCKELAGQVESMRGDNAQTIEPALTRLDIQLSKLSLASKRTDDCFDRDTERRGCVFQRFETLQHDRTGATVELQDSKAVLQKLVHEPSRIHKQAASIQKASRKLDTEILKILGKSRALDLSIKQHSSNRKEAEAVWNNLVHKLELHHDTLSHRRRDVTTLGKNVNIEKARLHQLSEGRVRLKLNSLWIDEHVRRESDRLSACKKAVELLRQRCRKKHFLSDASTSAIPSLHAQLLDSEHRLEMQAEETAKKTSSIDALKQETALGIGRLLYQEGCEDSTRSELQRLLEQVASLESEISNWTAEERRQAKLVAVLNAQREMKAREATRSKDVQMAVEEQVKVKGLVVLDSVKEHNELENRLKEFAALYDIVKNERNKYVHLIQSSAQALAEMREKIKILVNEVDILYNESVAKYKALSKERAQHHSAQTQRDALRLDLYKSQSQYRLRQEFIERHVVEIDKLNYTITNLERHMLRLKVQHDAAVEMRNVAGGCLIDRNDDLCVLYEKVNLQEQTFVKGHRRVHHSLENLRLERLRLAELRRLLAVTRHVSPAVPTLISGIHQLRTVLRAERCKSEHMCRVLELPANVSRWRDLPGADKHGDASSQKLALLRGQLSVEKRRFVESQLIQEEVANIISKLGIGGTSRDGESLAVSRSVSELKNMVRGAAKCVRALIAELSMYQAIALKLQSSKSEAVTKLAQSQRQRNHGMAPSEEAVAALANLLPGTDTLPVACMLTVQQWDVSQHRAQSFARTSAEQTSAEQRPNAYIPDVSALKIPRPYSSLAPFKPTQAGTTIRHIRMPRPLSLRV